MKMKIFLVPVLIFFICTINGSLGLKSRAKQNLGCNCLVNKYIEHELVLGLEYLNASMYMKHDSIALHGFGRMFDVFWHKQLNHANLLMKYLLKRGGVMETPNYKLRFENHDHFFNQKALIQKFLSRELELNTHLLELHSCPTKKELTCRGFVYSNSTITIRKKHSLHNTLYGTKQEITHSDPITQSFLDETFLGQKVDRIKYLTDLQRKIARFERFVHGKNISLGINPVGIHMIDNELKEFFSQATFDKIFFA